MISFPNAKINLGLYVTNKRPDGYHEIETIIYPIPFYDALEIRKSKTQKGEFTNLGIPICDINSEQNSVQQAFTLLKQANNIPPTDIILLKNIPFRAGLGGGSADAAFMLKLLNDYYSLGLDITALEKYASQIGSDDPAFIKNKPQLASGRGEILSESKVSLEGNYLVLINPKICISTADAYKGITPKPANFNLKKITSLPYDKWKKYLHNDFENNIFVKHPILKNIKEALYQAGAFYASLSGSGAAIFGIYKQPPTLHPYIEDLVIWKGTI